MDIQKKRMEIWRSSPLAPPHVEVSNHGRVRTIDRMVSSKRKFQPTQKRKGAMIRPWISKSGYLIVHIKCNGKRVKYSVHRLVASAFSNEYDPSLSVNHIDGNKINNNASNLEWVTLSENTRLQWKSGLVNLRGENHPSHKISADQARNIRKCMNSGVSPTALARSIGVSISLLYKIKDGSRWGSI